MNLNSISFNTSHVVVYRACRGACVSDVQRFNTSHVVVYPRLERPDRGRRICFNTSHVVVYHTVARQLNRWIVVSIHLMLLFIVGLFDFDGRSSTSFNTSHVVVYHTVITGDMTRDGSFNTSHVVVYHRFNFSGRPDHTFQYISCCCLSTNSKRVHSTVVNVSIHLMLLFIRTWIFTQNEI